MRRLSVTTVLAIGIVAFALWWLTGLPLWLKCAGG